MDWLTLNYPPKFYFSIVSSSIANTGGLRYCQCFPHQQSAPVNTLNTHNIMYLLEQPVCIYYLYNAHHISNTESAGTVVKC